MATAGNRPDFQHDASLKQNPPAASPNPLRRLVPPILFIMSILQHGTSLLKNISKN